MTGLLAATPFSLTSSIIDLEGWLIYHIIGFLWFRISIFEVNLKIGIKEGEYPSPFHVEGAKIFSKNHNFDPFEVELEL